MLELRQIPGITDCKLDAEVGATLRKILDRDVHVTLMLWPYECDGDVGVQADLVVDGKPTAADRSTLLGVLQALAGLEPTKQCRRCLQFKRINCFANNASQADNRCHYCRECESKRSFLYSQRKKKKSIPSTAKPKANKKG